MSVAIKPNFARVQQDSILLTSFLYGFPYFKLSFFDYSTCIISTAVSMQSTGITTAGKINIKDKSRA